MADKEVYRIDIPIVVDDQTDAPLQQAERKVSRFEQRVRKEIEQSRRHLEKIAKYQIEPVMKIRDQLTANVLKADKLIRKLDMAQASPLIAAQDRVSAVVTRVNAMLAALDKGKVDVVADMKGPLLDEIVKAKSALAVLNNVKAGPVAELRGELFGQLSKAISQIRGLDLSRAEPRATLRDRVTATVGKVTSTLQGLTSRAWTVTVSVKDKVTGFLGRVFKTLTSPLALLGIGGGAFGIGALIKDFTMTAGRTETLNIAMESVAKATGTSMKELLAAREAVMDLGIAEQEATLIMTRFMQGQLDIAQAANIARVAQDAAVIAGVNSSEAAETIVESIAKLTPELLAQFGFTKNLNDIYADYADQLGIVVKTNDKYGKTVRHMTRDMTEAEKKQAMLNYVLEEGAKLTGTYEGAMGSAFKKLGSLARYWTDFKTKIGEPLFLAAFGSVIDTITDAFKSGIEWAEKNQDVLERWGRRIAGVFDRVVGWVKRIIESPEFKEAGFAGKIKILIEAGIEEVNRWLEGPGGDIISNTIKSIGTILATGIEELTPIVAPPAVDLGLEIGKGIADGIYEAIKDRPWAGILLGTYVGFQLGGPKGAAIGAVAATLTWGLPKGFEALGKRIPGTEYYIQERLAEHERAEQMFGERRAVTPEGEPLFPGTELRAMPKRAIGGIFSRPHTALVAEAGPEAIIPLTKPERAWSLWQQVGDRMGFFEREKVVYNIPTKLMQQRMTYNIPDSSIENIQTATITRKMSEPLDKLQKETRHIITRGQDAISKITSIFKRINTYQTRLATEVNYHYLGPTSYQPLVKATAAKFNIPAGILARLIQAESSWNPSAVSPAGAFGLTQVMPATARGMGYSVDALRRSPALQIEAGAKYLSQQYKRFGSWPLALAAYNAGPGAVSKYGGIPPYRETQNYVAKILSPVKYAFGGILTRPHMGLVAEAGPEAIIPLTSRMRSRALGLWEETGRRLGVRTPELALGGAGGSPISVTNYISVSVNSSNADPDEIAEAIAIKLERSYHNMPRN